MSSERIIHSATLVKVVVLEPIELVDDEAESLKFRIEIFQWSSERFTCKLWREETYRLEPTFQAKKYLGEKWDVETYALETGLSWGDIEEESVGKVLEAVLQQIEQYFSVTIERPNIT